MTSSTHPGQKDAKKRAKHRKSQSVEEQQQVEASIGKEAVPEMAGKATGAWRDVLEMVGGRLVSRRQKSAVALELWRMHRAEEEVGRLEQGAVKREHNKAMQRALQQSRHPSECIVLGEDEQRMSTFS